MHEDAAVGTHLEHRYLPHDAGAGLRPFVDERPRELVDQVRAGLHIRFDAAARCEFSAQPQPATVDALLTFAKPVALHLHVLNVEHSPSVCPVFDRLDESGKVLPPKTFLLPPVIVDCRRGEGCGPLVCAAIGIEPVAGNREQFIGQRGWVDRRHVFVYLKRTGKDAPLGRPGEQPVAQGEGRPAVIVVVVGDGIELVLGRGCLAAGDQVSGIRVFGDRVCRVVDAFAQIGPHIEGLEFFDRV